MEIRFDVQGRIHCLKAAGPKLREPRVEDSNENGSDKHFLLRFL
jgi:hypothetical protein